MTRNDLISTHTPLAGRDRARKPLSVPENQKFQLTRPLRGATFSLDDVSAVLYISTHTPLAGRDDEFLTLYPCRAVFQLTRPLRGATMALIIIPVASEFQLTRPLRGATLDTWSRFASFTNFNSHAPCGARHSATAEKCGNERFQLTRPLRGATTELLNSLRSAIISTHTPLAGRDSRVRLFSMNDTHFNSHAPCGARLRPWKCSATRRIFQLTRPLRGATSYV